MLELFKLGGNHRLAIRGIGVLAVVILVISLGRKELVERGHLRDHRGAENLIGIEPFDERGGQLRLRLVMSQDDGAVLGASVGSYSTCRTSA